MTVRELRDKYLRFFESKGHALHPSGSLIPYDVTGKLDESLLFNGAGMVQFKPYFRGIAQPPSKRLTNAQKCVRTGDIEEVGDLTHLTFFEMMGNFSFGDYFKKEAIAYSWEFMTSSQWLGLDPKRISVTVFEEDDEAFNCWAEHFRAIGISPTTRIFRLGEETNYWPAGAFSKGPPGPCGPNTEMFYWVDNSPSPVFDEGDNWGGVGVGYSKEDWVRDEAQGKWLEIWNDVFIQYEWQGKLRNPDRPSDGYEKTGMPTLPFRSVDTGMGLERTATALGGLKSLYDTDVFQPIIRAIERLTGEKVEYGNDREKDRAIRIIADHIRTAVFCIADGILPSNNGRGYVLRRLIRRAVLKGQRVLGFDMPFFHHVAEGVREAMGDHYLELTERREVILETLKNEEALFRRTIDNGLRMLSEQVSELKKHGANQYDGSAAFFLYDTFGFPLEVTQELAEEAGLTVDLEGYEAALTEAQERSRSADGMDTVYSEQENLVLAVAPYAHPQTDFLGYQTTEAEARIAQISPRFGPDGKTAGHFQICLDQTPFYAESGGQVGDTGILLGAEFHFHVRKTWKEMGLIWHDCELERSDKGDGKGMSQEEITDQLESGFFFKPVRAIVDADRRKRIMRNHTATHLLHAALRQVLGTHVTQAGSLVAPDHLRFDFTHGKAMTDDELQEVEQIVNEIALSGTPVQIHQDIPIDQAKQMGAMALFGEKYGDTVRMVQVGDFSLELCGGIHLAQSSEIGLFKILHESSAASGVRRIEAVTGEKAYEWVADQTKLVHEAAGKLKTSPHELLASLQKALDHQRELTKKLERARTQAASPDQAQIEKIGDIELARETLTEGDAKDATLVADRLAEGQPRRVVVVALQNDGKVTFVCKVGPEAQAKGAHAGNLVKELAAMTGGGGGGRPDFATAGGKDAAKLKEALERAHEILSLQVAT